MKLEEGGVVGDWTLLRRADNNGRYWMCRCSCGAVRRVRGWNITSGVSRSCGHGLARKHDAVMAAAFSRPMKA